MFEMKMLITGGVMAMVLAMPHHRPAAVPSVLVQKDDIAARQLYYANGQVKQEVLFQNDQIKIYRDFDEQGRVIPSKDEEQCL